MMSLYPGKRPSVCSSGFLAIKLLTVVYGFVCTETLDLVPTELPPHPHNLSAEYSFSPSTWHNAQSQC